MIIKFAPSSGLAARPNRLRAGQTLEGHYHNYDHVSDWHYGTARVTVEPAELTEGGVWVPTGRIDRRIIRGPLPGEEGPGDECMLNIPRGSKHTIEALTDCYFVCWYVARAEDGEIKERFDDGDDYERVCG